MQKAAGRRLPQREKLIITWTISGLQAQTLHRKRTMDEFVIKGLVMQEIEYGESDRILKILTAERGLITAFAKHSMRLTSHLFAACGQLCYSEFVLRPGRNTEEKMYTVVEAGYEADFRDIAYSFEAQGVAMYMMEFTMALSLVEQPAEKELKLLMNCLYKICQKKTDPKIVKAVFELRMMCECGFMPQLLACRSCGAYDGDRFCLDVEDGCLLCADCAAKENKSCNLDKGALFAVRYICLIEDKKLFGFRISEGSAKLLYAAAEQYALAHMDKQLNSLKFLRSLSAWDPDQQSKKD